MEKLPESNYSVRFSDKNGRVSIVDKTTENAIESFSPCVQDEFIVQRMTEIRKRELFQHRFMNIGNNLTFGSPNETIAGGLVIPSKY
jgi:hypothetical protein